MKSVLQCASECASVRAFYMFTCRQIRMRVYQKKKLFILNFREIMTDSDILRSLILSWFRVYRLHCLNGFVGEPSIYSNCGFEANTGN